MIDLDYTWVTYGETAVRSLIATRTILDHCTIKFCSEPAVFHQSSGALMIQNCVLVSNQKSGIRVESSSQLPDTLLARGDSIAVNGACLTVVALDDDTFRVDVIVTTRGRTCLEALRPGSRVNLERAMAVGDRAKSEGWKMKDE